MYITLKGTLYIMSKQVTIYLSDELLNKIDSIETNKLSRFIDVYFNDEEYPFEDYEVKTEE